MAGTIITELDFNQIKTQFKTFLQGQTSFADYDYDGSNMSVILDVLSYNTFMNNFYSNMALGEMFLDSAQLRSSVVSHAKELNYLPRSYKASRAKVTLTFSPNDTPNFITIPKYTKFTSSIDGITYTFTTDKVYTITNADDTYSVSDVYLYEGRIEKEYFNVTADKKYVITNKKVDTDSINVKVYASSAADAEVTPYINKPNLFGVVAADKVFYLQPAEEYTYELTFGNNVFGREPVIGEVVEVTYRITNGEKGNGARSFTASGTVQGYTPIATLQIASIGGAEEESIESIKYYAPKSIQIQDRAVTESDYINLLKSQFSEIQAVSVYGGEEENPPKYGKVIVAVDIQDSDGVSEGAKEVYRKFLKERSPLSIDPIVVSPGFLYVGIESDVYYDTRRSAESPNSIASIVRSNLLTYSNTYLNDFRKNARQSRISRAIDDSDPAIVSNNTRFKMIIDFVPTIGLNSTAVVGFKNPLLVDQPLTIGEELEIQNPAVKTSSFTYNNSLAWIQDNGLGVLQILRKTGSGFTILNGNIGTVDYTRGTVIIRNLNVSAYSGSAIKIYAMPESQDILGPKDRIVSIRDVDVHITVGVATQ
jgi:hypothetical protein